MKRLSIFCLLALFYFQSSAQLKEIFYDDFSSNENKWALGEIENLSIKIENGKYIIDSKLKNTVTPQLLVAVDSSKDFSISVNVRSVTLNGPAEYGLIFGSNRYAYYCFAADTKGNYGLYYVTNNTIKEIIPVSTTKNLKKGINTTNRLEVRRSGKKWNLFINDSLVNSIASRKFYGPFIGMSNEQQKAEYDDLKVEGTAVATSGNLCAMFPLIFQSAKNNFEYIKGEAFRKGDTSNYYSSIQLLETSLPSINLSGNRNFFVTSLKNNHTKAGIIRNTDSVAAQLKKCLPNFVFTKTLDKNGLPNYKITQKINPPGKQPEVTLYAYASDISSDFKTMLSIYADAVKNIEPPATIVLPKKEKVPTSGWIVNDDFRDNRNGWLVDSANADFASYFKKEMFKNNTEYFVDNKNKTNSHFLAMDNVIYNENDIYKIEIEFNDYSGDDNKGNGLIFGCDKMAKNYFRFVITQTGSFRIDKITEAGETVIQEWKKSNVIFSNNKLGVISKKKLWSFYINDQQVYFDYKQPLFGNGAGIYISSGCAFFCKSFRAYDWTVAAKFPNEPKEPVYTNILNDVFKSNENNWSTINDADVTASVEDFGYEIENKYDGIYMPVFHSRMTTVDDYIAETRVMHIKGSDYAGYGLSFGKKDINNAYVFMINNAGKFRVGYYENAVWKDIKEWSDNKIIESAMASGNQVRISANSLRFENVLGQWKFYVNDSLVYNCPARSIDGDGIGFFADSKQTVKYQHIKINLVSFPAE